MYLSRVMLVGVLLSALCGCGTAPPPRAEPAATAPAPAAMVYVLRRAWHIDIGFAGADLNGANNVIRLVLTPGQLQSIQNFVWQTLSHQDSDVRPIADGPYGGSLFYATATNHSGVYTCNTWAAQALQSGGLGLDSTGVEFSGQVWRQVQRIARSQHPP